jgi:tetratricopeptide (TPR) repeat protein
MLVLSKLGINLKSVKAIRPAWQRAHYRAAINWLTKYKSSLEPSNFQKVKGYLESFHHFSTIQEWKVASDILSLQIDTPTNEELHEQLQTWGYYLQLIEIYNRLLFKLNYKWDIICLSKLGNIFDILGDYQQAIKHYEKWQKLAEENGDSKESALAICSLGIDLKESPDGVLLITAFIPNALPSGLRSLDSRKRVQLRGVINWLTKYFPPISSSSSKLEIVRGIIEAFYHLCNLEDWKSASQMLTIRLKPDRHHDLCDQLFIWGYSYEVMQLYQRLYTKLDSRWDGICLTGIGRVFNLRGDFYNAIQHLETSLAIFRHTGDRRREGLVLEQLGISYRYLESSKAIDYHQSSFLIAQEIRFQIGQLTSLGELGITYTLFEEDKLAIDCLQKSLALAQDANQEVERTIPLNGLGSFYLKQGKLEQAIEFGKTQLTLSREMGYQDSIANALCTLGEADSKTSNYSSALPKIQEALEIFRNIHSSAGEARALKDLAEIYYYLSQNDMALDFSDRALHIASRISVPLKNHLELYTLIREHG